MTAQDERPVTAHEKKVIRYYDELTIDFYLAHWNSRHIHFGLFDDEEVPKEGTPFAGPESLTRGLERMIDAIVAPANIQAHHYVADAGCGVGGTAMYLAETRGCRATGVNLNEVQLGIARTKAADAGLDGQVDFRYGNCSHRLPFDDVSVDAVVNIESACHYDDRRQFLAEVYRILKPGGQIAASDWLVSDDASAEQREHYINPLCKHWPLPSLESLSSYTKLLQDAGFTVLESTGFDGKDLNSLRLFENYNRTFRGLSFLGLLPARYRPVLQTFESLEKAWQDGSFELGRYHAVKPDNE